MNATEQTGPIHRPNGGASTISVPTRVHKLPKRLLRGAIIGILVFLVLCLVCTLFIQLYPFPKSPFFAERGYPQFTTIRSGKTGDPINVMILGSRQEIIQDFTQAGWKIPDPITPVTSAKIAADSLANLPYPTAPVSNLYLYHRKQDLAFENPTNDVQNRGHIRFWDTHTTLNHEEVWLGSASYDRGIELSGTTHLPTHHISPSVDRERTRVAVALKPYMKSVLEVPFDHPDLFRTNGGGDWYYTDGNIVILSAERVPLNDFRVSSVALHIKQQILQMASPILSLL